MRTIRIDVDTQFDFCAPSGALFVAGATAALDAVRALNGDAVARGIALVGSVDSHDFRAWEFNTNITNGKPGPFPPHCLKGTAGWLKMAGTLPTQSVFIPCVPAPDLVASAIAAHAALYFEKEVYSLFVNPNAAQALLQLAGGIASETQLQIYGVATDHCVKAAALGAALRGYRVEVVTDAIAAVDPATEQSSFAEMKAAGVVFVTAAELLSRSAA